MSIWTHVAATIRFDALRLNGTPDQRPDLGQVVHWGDPDHRWDTCNVPRGSEGSLSVHLWENPDRSDLAAYTATIWGDLRDYENVGEVLAYLRRITEGRMVRQGIATIEVEGQMPVIARYNDRGEAWVVGGMHDAAPRR